MKPIASAWVSVGDGFRKSLRVAFPLFEETKRRTAMAGKFEISKDKAGKYRFHLKAANGEIIAASQGYETKASAEKGIESVRMNAREGKVEDLTEQEPAHN
jgi:uncharacterized protein YegP (UPF0339 family)